MPSFPLDAPDDLAALARRDTARWLERAVIGLNLCPFAKAVHVKGQIHYAVCTDANPQQLLSQLSLELNHLRVADASAHETTLLIATSCLQDFLDYNEFIGRAELALKKARLEGEIQIATFHPNYQFAGVAADDITNYTNRSPYPMLHLLREASVDRAVAAFPEAEDIYETNMRRMEQLGHGGWQALDVGPHR